MENEEKKVDDGFKTPSNYFNFEYSKKHGSRAKKATRILTVAFAFLMLGNGIYNTVGAFQTDEKLARLDAEISRLERTLDGLDEGSREYENYAMQLDFSEQQRESYKKIKTLDIVGAVGSVGVVAALLSLRKFLEKIIDSETDKRKKQFYQEFLDEIVFIQSDSSYASLDYLISFVLRDAADELGMSFDGLLNDINKEEVFPEFERRYSNILSFIDEYLQTHDYEHINPEVYRYLPVDYIQFASFLKKKGVDITQFRSVPYDKAVSLMEEFLSEYYKDDEKKSKKRKKHGDKRSAGDEREETENIQLVK